MAQHRTLEPAEIERRVSEGEPIVVYEGYVLHLGQWINTHPGGRLAILHMVGRDATDEINMSVHREHREHPGKSSHRNTSCPGGLKV